MTGEATLGEQKAPEPDVRQEMLAQRLSDISGWFKVWRASLASDSIRERATGQAKFASACHGLDELLRETWREPYECTLTVGEQVSDIRGEPVLPTHIINSNDSPSINHRRPLHPGDALTLSMSHTAPYPLQGIQVHYFGDSYMSMVEAGELAQALEQGSILEVKRIEADVSGTEIAA